MKYKNFEEYLMMVCAEDTHALDDMLPDVYEDWIAEQDIEDVIDLANLYGTSKFIEGSKRAIKKMENSLLNLQEDQNE